jgi:CRP/FNR family transcriptional regulator
MTAANATRAGGRRVPCEKCPLMKYKIFRPFNERQLQFVSQFKTGEFHAESGATLFLQNTNSPHLYTVLSGWAFRYKMLPDGKRQILNFALPGDLLGLQASIFNEMQHSVETLTNVVLCTFAREKVWSLFADHPGLAFDLTWLASREEQILDENLLSVGQRSATARAAYLLLHLFTRAEQVGLTAGNTIKFPFNQQHVADTLGLSLVHTNRTLKKLSARKLIRWKDKVFYLLDREGLRVTARVEEGGDRQRPYI